MLKEKDPKPEPFKGRNQEEKKTYFEEHLSHNFKSVTERLCNSIQLTPISLQSIIFFSIIIVNQQILLNIGDGQ